MAYPKMGEITDKFVGQPYDLNSVLSPAKVWEKLDAQSEEVRVFVNGLIDLLNSTGEDNWLYTAIVNAILGQITDGSLTDVKLSDETGQIKDRFTSFIATYDAFVATKGVANGIASLGADTKLEASQLPLTSVSGSFTDTTTAIAAGGTYTKTIPLGLTGVVGSCFLNGIQAKTMVNFFASETMAYGLGDNNTASTLYWRTDGALAHSLAVTDDNYIKLTHCYINGTDLIFVFENSDTAAKTLGINSCVWEVQV